MFLLKILLIVLASAYLIWRLLNLLGRPVALSRMMIYTLVFFVFALSVLAVLSYLIEG